MEEKKITPLEFINYLKGFLEIVKGRNVLQVEVEYLKKILYRVDVNAEAQPIQNLNPYFDYVPYPRHNSTVPDPNYYNGWPENICYCYKKEE